jgi:3-deoxy-manno-octulosonate cytidylyltransferase (CMP-KDO synthetase)
MTCAVIIPARFDSTRFPGKVLMRGPSGKPLIQYTWEAATRAEGVDETLVATDDERIAEAVRAFGGEVRMTRSAHRTGSDRCAEVAGKLRHDLVVNLQADEAGIRPEMIWQTVRLLREDPECEMSTLACPIRDESELSDPDVVKVVLDCRSRALYFSRAVIPHVRGSGSPLRESPAPHLRHHGIYGYRREALLAFAALPPHPLEQAEKLEQLRALANGYKIIVGVTPYRTLKVDTREDFEAFCAAEAGNASPPRHDEHDERS